ncbi:CRP-like cAMP-binding protein [Dyadobacter jejuensis]|uniref:CRP-like cAMP-binding protein n=1 Tax=Dyadobacter jejuensis TaxID=1082580 RepID=A0A316AHM5_9BACT|nr:Crp/Fnr family transcriptional regulator [Dyadobacter jejuensis]PWJ57172.1 CRP-like cAMP-binding protein [Dyadobacter jejuensis]
MQQLFQYLCSISPLTPATLRELEGIFCEVALRKHESFVEAGKVAKKFGILEHGILRAYYRTEGGQEYNKHFFRAPCFIGGFSSLVTGEPSPINLQALTDCHIWEADYHSLTKRYDEWPDLERLSRILAEQYFVQKERREVEIVLLNADKRYQIFKNEFPELENLIPQYHIASYLGITPTQLSRIRKMRTKG